MIEKKEDSPVPTDHSEFAWWFITEYDRQIKSKAYKHLILNRYSSDDIKHYMVERILEILTKRKNEGNPIEEPKLYFRKLIPFWCVEYQRMNGFIFGLPKRPRCQADEDQICSYGFTYLRTQSDADDCPISSHVSKLSYIDVSITEPNQYFTDVAHKGIDPDTISESWTIMMEHLKENQAKVIEYLYRYNLTVAQTAQELGIAVSTAYQRKNKALIALSGFICSKSENDTSSWYILNSIL